MIFWKEPLICEVPYGCNAEMYPADVRYPHEPYTDEGARFDRVILIMECPRCKESRRWACLITDSGDIFVPHRRVLVNEWWPEDLLPEGHTFNNDNRS